MRKTIIVFSLGVAHGALMLLLCQGVFFPEEPPVLIPQEPLLIDRENYTEWAVIETDTGQQILVEGEYLSISKDEVEKFLSKNSRLKRLGQLVMRVRDGTILTVEVFEKDLEGI